MKYKVKHLQDYTYQVIEMDGGTESDTVYQGNLSDCEAYIRLHENGYM